MAQSEELPSMDIAPDVPYLIALIEERLQAVLAKHCNASLIDPIQYALFPGGKRLRPTLTLLIAAMLGVDPVRALPAACAVELIHASSLILDDLPCMDNATTRRGRPACHLVHGESPTILAAIEMLTLAYVQISEYFDSHSNNQWLVRRLLSELFDAMGTSGLIGGQVADIASSKDDMTYDVLSLVNQRKTTSLFLFAAVSGALVADASSKDEKYIRRFALHFGAAYQLLDDLHDLLPIAAEQPEKDSDKDRNKCTFVRMTDPRSTSVAIRELLREANKQLEPYGTMANDLRRLINNAFASVVALSQYSPQAHSR